MNQTVSSKTNRTLVDVMLEDEGRALDISTCCVCFINKENIAGQKMKCLHPGSQGSSALFLHLIYLSYDAIHSRGGNRKCVRL